MAFWCYLLRCADGRFYTGHTDDLERRVGEHQAGGHCAFTTRRRPVALAWAQDFPSRLEALEAERRIGPWSRAKKEALIAGDWAALSHWARPPRERPSTSLGTNGGGENQDFAPAAPFLSSGVEGPPTPLISGKAATRLPLSVAHHAMPAPAPFAPSDVEGHASTGSPA